MRPLALITVAALSACGGAYPACPTGVPLQREDLPCTCGEEDLQGLSECGTLSCDGETWTSTGACEDDTGDGGDTGDTGDSG